MRNRRASSRDPLSLESKPGVNIRAPWSRLIMDGTKVIETRFYPLPKKYINQPMALVETPGRTGSFKARVVGIVVFGEPFPYKNEGQFYRDSKKHLVEKTSPDFTWASGNGKTKWGWPIISVRKYEKGLPVTVRKGIVFTKAIPIHGS